jgi:hypothetical protein
MKRIFSFIIAWLAFFQTGIGQTTTVTLTREDLGIDTVQYDPSQHKEISLDLQVAKNQKFLKKIGGSFVETPPAIIEIREKTKGNRYAKVYVNSDYLSIVCHGINSRNFRDYQGYKQYLPDNDEINIDSFSYPLEFMFSKTDPATLLDDQVNDEKARFFKTRLWYCIKDKAGKIVTTLTVEFVFPKPQLNQIFINKELIQQIKDRPAESLENLNGLTERNNMELARENNVKVGLNDTTNVPLRLVLRPGIHDILFQFNALNFRTDNFLEYRLNEGAWKTSFKKEFPLILLEDLKPGKYTLQVRYLLQPAVFEYAFELEAAFTQTTAFKVITGSLITGILGIALFLIYSSRQKKKLKEEVNKRTQLQHRISYLQSQLQPHFIFNALNSIQGLINKRNIEDANIYISKFGALLHEVIGKNDKTMQPLATEIKQVEYYLQLEQLRFKFQYKIAVAENVNATEVSIPTMLLQPYVENAIKHGIVEKKEAGLIEVVIGRNKNDLFIEIKDNGKGYDVNTITAGRGNAMVEERIQALNSFLEDQRITLATSSISHTGTTVSITFINWF